VKKHLNRGALKQLTAEALHQLMLELAKFSLTKAEKLQIVNMRPTSKVELHVVCNASTRGISAATCPNANIRRLSALFV